MKSVVMGPCDEGIARSVPALRPCEPSKRRWVLAATILGSSMAFVDGTVVNVALPVLQERLGASVSSAQWVIEAYLLFLSSLVLLGGSLGDRIGRRRVFVGGVVLFAVSSAACGLATGIRFLITARAAQGVGAALLVPSSLAILGAAFPPRERGRAVGVWSSLTSIAGVIGPVLGGWLVQTSSWRAVFFINLPIAAAVIAIALAKMPESHNPSRGAIDLPGTVLATSGLAGLVFGLIEAPVYGWKSPRVWACAALGLGALIGFPIVESRARNPMVPPALFRIRAFAGTNLLTLFLYAAFSGATFILPFNLIQAQGYSPAAAGAALLPPALLIFTLSRWAGATADRVGPRILLIWGPAIAASGFLLLALPQAGARFVTAFLPGLCLLGLGMAITVAPLTATVLGAVDPEQEGIASGINNAVARVAGLLAIAALGIVAFRCFDRALERRLSRPGFSAAARQIPESERRKLGAAQPPSNLGEGERRAVKQAIAASLVTSFRVVMGIAAVLALLASAAAALFIGSGTRNWRAPPTQSRAGS